MEYLTTAQRRKAQQQADYVASLGPKNGPRARKPASLTASAAQTMLTYGGDGAKLHRPDCHVIDRRAAEGFHARPATAEELRAHSGCGHCH